MKSIWTKQQSTLVAVWIRLRFEYVGW